MFEMGARVWNHRHGYGTVKGRCAHLYYVKYDSGCYENESSHYLKPVRYTAGRP
jgi:hypothetical protein